MKEWIIQNIDATVIAAICGVLVSLVSAITGLVSFVKSRNTRKALEKALEERRIASAFTICPHCKKKVPLADLHFYDGKGNLDDNLNGIPDAQE